MRGAVILALIAALAPAGARAELPPAGCFVLAPGPRPAGIERLALRLLPPRGFDATRETGWRYAELAVLLGPARAAAAGKPLTQSLRCRIDRMACAPDNGTGWLEVDLATADRMVLSTLDLPVADYGESDLEANLADPPGTETVLNLVRAADDAACAIP